MQASDLGRPPFKKSLFSTASDYLRFAHMMMNGDELDGVRILSPRTAEFMTIDHIRDPGGSTTSIAGPRGIISDWDLQFVARLEWLS